MPLAAGEAEQNMKLDTAQWQVPLNAAIPIHAHWFYPAPSLPDTICATHIVYALRIYRRQGPCSRLAQQAYPAATEGRGLDQIPGVLTGWITARTRTALARTPPPPPASR